MIALRNRPISRSLRLVLAAGLLVVGPSVVLAQQTVEVPNTHTVKKGDTLWDLAQHYLGDAFRWPEIYRMNTDVVEDPHWIYPGEILKLPGYVGTEMPGLAQPGRHTVPFTPPTAAQLDSKAVRPSQPRAPSIFANRGQRQQVQPQQPAVNVPDTMTARPGVGVDTMKKPVPAVRYGDFVRAPWIDRLKGPPAWGRIVGAADLPGIAPAAQRGRFQINDRVLIAPPTGSVGQERDTYLAYRNGPSIEEVGQIIIPTGIVEVIRPPVNGEAAIARVVWMFGEVSERDRLMPLDSSVGPTSGVPVAVKNGVEGEVRWIAEEPVLPSPTYYMVVSLTAADVKAGDEIELFQPRVKAKEEMDFATPEITVGRAQVIRATPYGATVLITRLDQPKIEPRKTKVRVVAKMQ
jgi:LysM repeat protein